MVTFLAVMKPIDYFMSWVLPALLFFCVLVIMLVSLRRRTQRVFVRDMLDWGYYLTLARRAASVVRHSPWTVLIPVIAYLLTLPWSIIQTSHFLPVARKLAEGGKNMQVTYVWPYYFQLAEFLKKGVSVSIQPASITFRFTNTLLATIVVLVFYTRIRRFLKEAQPKHLLPEIHWLRRCLPYYAVLLVAVSGIVGYFMLFAFLRSYNSGQSEFHELYLLLFSAFWFVSEIALAVWVAGVTAVLIEFARSGLEKTSKSLNEIAHGVVVVLVPLIVFIGLINIVDWLIRGVMFTPDLRDLMWNWLPGWAESAYRAAMSWLDFIWNGLPIWASSAYHPDKSWWSVPVWIVFFYYVVGTVMDSRSSFRDALQRSLIPWRYDTGKAIGVFLVTVIPFAAVKLAFFLSSFVLPRFNLGVSVAMSFLSTLQYAFAGYLLVYIVCYWQDMSERIEDRMD